MWELFLSVVTGTLFLVIHIAGTSMMILLSLLTRYLLTCYLESKRKRSKKIRKHTNSPHTEKWGGKGGK